MIENPIQDLVTRFCLDWVSPDVEKLVPFLTDMALPGSKSRIGGEPAA